MLYKEVARSEILDWWDETRDLVARRCEAAQSELISLADERTTDLGTVDLLNPCVIRLAWLAPSVLERLVLRREPTVLSIFDLCGVAEMPRAKQPERVFD